MELINCLAEVRLIVLVKVVVQALRLLLMVWSMVVWEVWR